MEGIVTSDVPGLEHEAAREGTATASLLTAVNYWHRRAQGFEALSVEWNQVAKDAVARANIRRVTWMVLGAALSIAMQLVLKLVVK